MRETISTIYGFDGFVLPKMFRAIFYLFYDRFMTSPARTDIFQPGGMKNAV